MMHIQQQNGKGKEKEEPVQKSTLVFVMFYVLGTLSHVPQSFYVTANDYWMYKFRNPNETSTNTTDTKTDLQAKFTSYYSVVSNISMVTGLVITVFLIKRWSPQGRIVTTLSCLLGLLIVTVLFAWIDTDTWQMGFFIVSLLIGVLLNSIGAMFLLSIFHLAMKFPAVYLGAVLSGQSICGIMSSLIQIVTLAVGTSSKVNATLYFIIGIAFTAGVQVVYMTVLVKRKYYQDQVNRVEKLEPLKLNRSTIFNIVKKIYVLLLTMVFAAGMMVAMHPGVTSLVESTNKGYGRWGDVFFVPVCTFLTYNVFDFVGRECSFRFKWTRQEKKITGSPEENRRFVSPNSSSDEQAAESGSAKIKMEVRNHWILLVIAVLRLGFIPLTLFCNVQPRHHLPVYLEQDWEYFIIIVILAFSNGYVMNLCIVGMPKVCDEEEMKFASVLIILVMVASLAVCSVFGPVLITLV